MQSNFLRKTWRTKINIISANTTCLRYEVGKRDVNVIEQAQIPKFSKRAFTYYIMTEEGRGVSKMLTLNYVGRGVGLMMT